MAPTGVVELAEPVPLTRLVLRVNAFVYPIALEKNVARTVVAARVGNALGTRFVARRRSVFVFRTATAKSAVQTVVEEPVALAA